MSSRERTLMVVFLAAVLVIGGGGGFHIFFWKPYSALQARLDAANKDIATKTTEKDREEKEIQRIEGLDPRLTRWETVSLPATTSRDSDKLERHISQEVVDYEAWLSAMLKDAGFQSISTAAKKVDNRAVPTFANKTPIYTKLAFTVEAKATFKSVVQMFEDFYRAEKLHQVRDFKVRRAQTRDPIGQQPGQPPGVQPQPGGNQGQGRDRSQSLLDVNMTVEALIVNGAKTREARPKVEEKPRPSRRDAGRPKGPDAEPPPIDDFEEQEEEVPAAAAAPAGPVVGILAPARHYEDMLMKNMYTGIQGGRGGELSEDARSVLSCVRLTMVDNTPSRWNVEFYDQAKGSYLHCTPDFSSRNGFEVRDRYDRTVLEGKVVDANIWGIVFEAKGQFYKMRLGEFLDDVINPPKDAFGKIKDKDRQPLKEYTRGDWKGPLEPEKKAEPEKKKDKEPEKKDAADKKAEPDKKAEGGKKDAADRKAEPDKKAEPEKKKEPDRKDAAK
jgi:hypothetical protein